MKALSQVVAVLFFLMAALGFVYFGPSEYTGYVTRTDLYRFYVGPYLDRLMALTGQGNLTIAYLVDSEGSVDYTPGNDTVTLSARPGQRFPRRTVVSTGSASRAQIAMWDNSKIVLEADSTVLLDLAEDNPEVMRLKIVAGRVVAEKSASSTALITVVSPKGVEKTLTSQKLAVIAPKATPGRDAPAAEPAYSMDSPESDVEFFGVPDEPIAEIEKRLLEERKAAIGSQDAGLEALAVEDEAARQAATPSPVESLRQPASIPDVAYENVPAEALPKVIKPRRKPASVKWAPPPEGNDISGAFYAERTGKPGYSKRLLASSLTKPAYKNSENFNEATRVALDGLLRGYVESGNPELARETLSNTERTYAGDPAAMAWAKAWRRRLGRSSSRSEASRGSTGGPDHRPAQASTKKR